MKTEIEAKFLSVDVASIQNKLSSIGAECKMPIRLMRRAIFNDTEGKMKAADAYVRVRDEGHKVTLTYKKFEANSVDGAKEIEVTVSDFDDTVAILEVIGLKIKSIQESKRETWQIDDVEIVIDEWPWLNPYIEIEGSSEEAITAVATKLNLPWSEAVFGDVNAAYRAQYTHLPTGEDNIGKITAVRFSDPIPSILKK